MTARTAISADEQEVRKAVDLLLDRGEVIELRALEVPRGGNGFRYTASGYFDDADRLVEEAVRLSQTAKGVYVTMNPVATDLLARACNRTRQMNGRDSSTGDTDIPRRKWFGIDLDPCRVSGVSSTDEEHEAARDKAREIWDALLDLGFPDPIYASSGNGGHLMYRVDLPADDGGLLKRCLAALAFHFDDERVTVDQSVFNPSRIWKLYGTVVRKGDDTPDRPHRVARMLFSPPDGPEVVSAAALEELARWLPEDEPQPQKRVTVGAFDIERWIEQHGVPVGPPSPWGNGGRRWRLDACPWNAEHKPNKAFIVQHPSGAIAAGCLKADCRHHNWRDLRILYEPDAYSRDRVEQSSPGQEAEEPVLDLPTSFRHGDLVTGELPPVPWLVEGLLPKGGICMLAGDSGVGKSWIGFHLGQTVAAGIPFLGHFQTERGGVLYLDAESGENLIRRRFKKLWRGLEDEHLDPDIPFDVLLSAVNLDPQGSGLRALTDRIRRDSISLVVLDPMIHFGSAEENESRDMASFLEGIRGVSRDTGTVFLLIHHVRKESRISSNAAGQMIRGSSAIRAVMDSVLYVRRLNDGRLQVEHDKSRHAEPTNRFMVEITDPDEETTCISYGGESGTVESSRAIAEEAILRTVADMGGTAKRQLIVEQCIAEGVSKRTVTDALKGMTSDQRLTKAQRGKEAFYSLPEVSNQAGLTLEENW